MATTASFWDKLAPKYAASPIRDMASYEYTLERVQSHLGAQDEVLEVGCGTGTTALHLAPSVSHMTATDISGGMIAIADGKARDQGAGNVSFKRATILGSVPDGQQYDAILAFNLLHLVEDLEGALAALHDGLKPGGLFISKTPCLGGMWYIKPLIWGMQLVGKAPFVRLLRPAALEEMVTATGFQIIETGTFPVRPGSRFLVARKV